MPGVLFDQFYKGGSFGFHEGKAKIVGICSAPHYYGANNENPACAVRVQYQALDDKFEPTNEEPQWHEYDCGPLGRFTPGMATDENSVMDCEDLGVEKEVEGNCINSANGERIGGDAGLFFERLRELGFRQEVMNKGYLPSFIGVVGTLKKEVKPKSKAKDPTVLLFDTPIIQFPWDQGTGNGTRKGAAAAAAKKTTAAAPAPAAKAAPKAAAAPAPAPAAVVDASDAAAEFLADLARTKLGQSKNRQNVLSLTIKIKQTQGDDVWNGVKEILKDDDQVEGLVEAANGLLAGDDPVTAEIIWNKPTQTFTFSVATE